AGRLLGADHAMLSRHDPGGAVRVMASWSSAGPGAGTQMNAGDGNQHAQGFRTRPEDRADVSGWSAEVAREFGFHASAGAPVTVAGRVWGVMIVASTRAPLPVGTEARLAAFTELAATAIDSAQARTELRSFAEEQAALRRVSMLVARAAPPEQVFTLVA